MNPKRTDQQELAILQGAVENTNEAFVTIDENHTVIFFNRAAENIFGFSRAEVVGKDLNIILSSRCSQDHRKAVKRYLETKAPRRIGHETELNPTRKNGETFPASISFSVAHVEGRPFFTAVIRDLSTTRALQEQITKTERLAALGQIVAEITHDIKNPILLIGAYARQLMRQSGNTESAKKLSVIAEEVKRLEGLLGEINDFYIMRSLKLEVFDIHDLLGEICSLVQHDCQEKNIQLDCQTPGEAAWVEADRDKWKQVLLNLIRNGIEAMDQGGNLHLHCRLAGPRVEMIIRDNGPGIPPNIQSEIFTPFFTTKQRGTGLGLPISKRIIEDHPGSSIEVFSEEGKGTEVRLTLPRDKPPTEGGQEPQGAGR
jgi:two-component system sensor kinase FixL